MSVDTDSCSSVSSVEEMESKLQRKDNKIEELEKKVRKLEEDVQYYAFERSLDLEPSLPISQDSPDGSFEEILKLERTIEEQKQEISELKRLGNAKKRNQGNILDKRIHSQLNEVTGKCKKLEENLEKSKVEVEEYRQKCDEFQKRVQEMESDKTTWSKEQQQKFETDRAKLKEELRTLQTNLDHKSFELEGEASKCRQYEEDLQSKEEEWRREKEQLESTVTQKVTELHRLEENMEMERVQHDTKVQILMKEKVEEEIEKNEFKMQVTHLQEVNKRMTNAREEDQLSYKQLQEKSKKDSDKIDELRQAKSDYMKALDDRNREIKKLTERIKALDMDQRKLLAEKERYQQEFQSAKDKITALMDEVLASKCAAESYEDSFKKESQAKEMFGKKCKDLERELQQEKEVSKTLHEKIDKLSRDKRDLMEQLNTVAASQCLDVFTEN